MLPAPYQIPAAVILLVGGFLACFAGYRLFRVVLAIYGFILGALVASSIMAPGEQLYLILAAIGGGLVGALLLNLAYFVGVALVGAAAGAFLLHVAWTRLGTGDPHVAIVVGAAVLGAIAASVLQRYVIVAATALGGAWTMIVGGLALAGDEAARTAAATSGVWVAYPFHPGPGREWIVWAWLALGAIGTVVQLRTPSRVRARKPRKKVA